MYFWTILGSFTDITTLIFNSLFTASADFPYNGQAIGDGVNRNSAIIGGRKNVFFTKWLQQDYEGWIAVGNILKLFAKNWLCRKITPGQS